MSTESPESRLRETLTTVANSTSPELEFAQIVARLDAEPTSSTSNRRWLLAAAAGLLVVAGSFAWLGSNSDNTFELDSAETTDVQPDDPDPTQSSFYVLKGEVVLSEEPLIVQAAAGPEPLFSTSGLGTEITFEDVSVCDVNELYDGWWKQTLAAYPDSVSIKFTVIGNVWGHCLYVGVSDHPYGSAPDIIDLGHAPADNIRVRSIGSSEILLLESFAGANRQSLQMMDYPSFSDPTSGGIASSRGIWDGFPAETSVVVIEDKGQTFWARPRSGTVFLPPAFSRTGSTMVGVFDVDGNEVFQQGGEPAEPINPELADDRFSLVSPPPQFYVLAGEPVLTEDPLIVQALMGPEPEFDTSELGTEVLFSPVEGAFDPGVQDLLVVWREQALDENPEAVPIKFVVVGRPMVAGQAEADGPAESDGLVVIGISDHRLGTALDLDGVSPETNVRSRWVHTPEVGFGFGDRADRSSLTLIAFDPYTSTSINGPVHTSGSSPQSFVWDEVPSDVSVVILEGTDQRLWTRPNAGLAYFLLDPDLSRPQTLIALDAGGDELFRTTVTE